MGYIYYISLKLEKKWGLLNTFFSVAIVIFGISNFITGNVAIIFFNYVAIILLIIVNMMYLFIDTSKFNFSRHLALFVDLGIGTLSELPSPFRQVSSFLKSHKSKKNNNSIYVLIGLVIAIPLIIVLLMLLATADVVFGETLISLMNLLSLGNIFSNIIGLAIMLLAGYTIPYAFTKYINGSNVGSKELNTNTNEPIIAIIVTGAASLVYVFFSAIQIIYLFLGKGTLPADYTYAEYAREGFFQLLFISIFNMVMILVCIEFFKNSKILKAILTIVSGCTFVMIASSAYRMSMYIGEYGLTFTRILVLWMLAVIALIMIGFFFRIFKETFNIFKFSTIVVTICFALLSLSHIDYFIAKYDLNMYEQMEKHHSAEEVYEYVDYDYLMELSTDAAPAIMEHKEEVFKYMKDNCWDIGNVSWSYKYYGEYDKDFNLVTIRKFNLSKHISRLSMNE